jgi:hypothetical protein
MRWRVSPLGVRLMLALLAAAPAAAAKAPDSDYSTKETRALMHAYAKCVVRGNAAKASEAIAANADNSTLLRRYRMLMSPECLGNAAREDVSMRFGGDLYRYALADALVNRDLAGWTVPDLETVPRLVHRDPGEAPLQVTEGGKRLGKRKYEEALAEYEKESAYAYLSRYGECVVRNNPGGSKALLLTGPDTPQETAAFTGIRPALERCLSEGRTLRFGRVTLRGSIAINFYRLAHAARTSGVVR